ncbi:MAG TPA: transporter substrate-binding domain-containing protein, partial [Alphaproteobacteria bacterium]
KQVKNVILTIIVAVIAALLVFKFIPPKNVQNQVAAKESVYEKVVRTNTLRCGYVTYAPYLVKDPNTGKMSGIFYDLTEKMGELLNLKIEWTHETTFGTFVEDMKSGRYDVYCGGLWAEVSKSRFLEYTRPVNYVGLGVYVRIDDTRFDNGVEILNDKNYKFATLDGEMSDFVAKQDFPDAHVVSHTHNTDASQLVLDVVTKKADAVIIERAVANEYEKKNPGSLKNLMENRPIRLFGNTWAALRGSPDLVNMMDMALEEMTNSGAVDKTISQYDPGMTNFYPIALPFQSPSK